MSSRQQGDKEPPVPPSGATGGPQAMAGLGGWERHTKGIGSKLLQKMGYKPGEGLGKNSDGRIDPVKLEANKGRSMLGANSTNTSRAARSRRREDDDDEEEDDQEFLERGRRRRRRRLRAPGKRRGSDADEDAGSSSSSSDGNGKNVARFESDQQSDEESDEDQDGPEYVAKCLLASNRSMIQRLKEECQMEQAKRAMLEKTMDELRQDLRLSEDIIATHRGVLRVITDLESIYRSDKLNMAGFWNFWADFSSISPTTRSHLIQIFALPLLKKQYQQLMIKHQSHANSELLDLELEQRLFKDMIDVAREWLKTKSGYPALIEWYLEWKSVLQLDAQAEVSRRRKYFRRCLLDVMHLATIKSERDLNSFHYVPCPRDETTTASREGGSRSSKYHDHHSPPRSSARGGGGDPQQPLSFKQLIEQQASERGLLFRPASGRLHESKQIYKLETVTLYIDQKIIYVRKGDRWQPQTLEDVMKNFS